MLYRPLGRTGIRVSVVAFGAGPVPGLMTVDGRQHEQLATVQRAIDLGINWFDTAATYGAGKSEQNLGFAIRELGAAGNIHIATKVRLAEDQLADIRGAVLRSCEESLQRLGVPQVSLLQLHNSVTKQRNDEPTSITTNDVFDTGGVLQAMQELRRSGLVRHLGLTGLGNPSVLRELFESGEFETVQTPYNMLNPSAGQIMPQPDAETDYGNQFATCLQQRMGVFAIRVFAGGALVGNPPSDHTKKTPFFPLALYQRDQQRAERLAHALPAGHSLKELSLQFVLRHPAVSAAIIGFASPEQVDEIASVSTI
jgi:aryl-alcohol dehydrogenase-like predicted oxidoreductase